MLEWDDLRHFLAIARHRTLSGAARALGVQQSTMGRRLEALEARVGAKLLQKTPAGFVLTEVGEAILGNVERIESESLIVERVITGKDMRLEGSIRLTAVENFTVRLLTPILAKFQEKYPGITLELVTDTRLLSLTKREADVAVRFARFTQQDLAVRKVAEVAFGVYASRAYLERYGAPNFAEGAPSHRIILALEDLMSTPHMTWFSELTRRASLALRSNSSATHVAAAEADMGICCVPRYFGDTARLNRIETSPPAPLIELWMGVHNDIRHMPRIREITNFIAAGLKQQANVLNPP